MPRLASNGIELEYEIHGSGEPLVLIMGIGSALVNWPDGFVDALVAQGFRVILFDNRDAGLSTYLQDAGAPDLGPLFLRAILGRSLDTPYTLSDMADDVAGLIEGLELESAHVLGVSLGGMVAQTLAITHPARVRTLTSVMSTTGSKFKGLPRLRALKALLGKAPRNEAEAVSRMLHFRRVCGSTGFPFDAKMHAAIARRQYRRGVNPQGFARQFAAIMATGDRTAALRFVRTPTLVFHGAADPLIPLSGGRATARAIPGARLKVIKGLGHDLPREVWPILSQAVADHVSSHSAATVHPRAAKSTPVAGAAAKSAQLLSVPG